MTHHAPLIFDIAGTQLTAVDKQRLHHPLTGGVILFGRNWQSRTQLTQLCADIKAVRGESPHHSVQSRIRPDFLLNGRWATSL